MTYSLSQPPSGIGIDVWAGSGVDLPSVGDLWLLSWDGNALELAVVSGVASSFVLAWPVTLRSEPTFPPAVAVEQSPLGGIGIWPSRETGVGAHLLHRNLGPAVSRRTMALISNAFDEEGELPLPFAEPNVALEDRAQSSDEMVDCWEAINTHLWPQPILGQTPLDADALRSRGIQVARLREILDLSTPEAVALLRGERSPSRLEVELLAKSLEVPAGEILLSRPDKISQELLAPRIKDDVLKIAGIYNVDESGARMLLREQFALAARSDQTADSRLDAAIHRLLNAENE